MIPHADDPAVLFDLEFLRIKNSEASSSKDAAARSKYRSMLFEGSVSQKAMYFIIRPTVRTRFVALPRNES